MAQCPTCQSEIQGDFGMLNCGKCGAFVFVDLEGNSSVFKPETPLEKEAPFHTSPQPKSNDVLEFHLEDLQEKEKIQATSEEGESDEEPFSTGEEAQDFSSSSYENQNDIQNLSGSEGGESQSEELDPEESQNNELQNSSSENINESFENSSSSLSSPETSSSEETDYDFEKGIEASFNDTEKKTNFQDIQDFANSESSLGKEGILTYNIYLKGIDSSEIRKEVKEALEDQLLNFNLEELWSRLDKGELKIENVNSVKTHILVKRLKHLDIHITWYQHSLHE